MVVGGGWGSQCERQNEFGYLFSSPQELFSYGTMNLGGSFFGSFPSAGALSRTVLQDATGGHTQVENPFLSSVCLSVFPVPFLSTFSPPLCIVVSFPFIVLSPTL